MKNMQLVYKGEFTIEQRKIMTAQMLQELRKTKKLSQKEVAAYLSIPATTYNTYESGRTEPPIEILVRLSHLYGMPIDIIVQRDRAFGTAEKVGELISVHVIARPHMEVDAILPKGRHNGSGPQSK